MLSADLGMRRACAILNASRSTIQRHLRRAPAEPAVVERRASHRRLSEEERAAILDTAHRERFCDQSVREIYATLLDEGVYLGSISTMYRVLRDAGETRERRGLAKHPPTIKPELAASAPGQVWSWDITKLLGPQKWTYYYLYVVLDVFSRYVVGWRVEYRESAHLAEELFTTTVAREGIDPQRLTVHSDGGSTMTSKTLTSCSWTWVLRKVVRVRMSRTITPTARRSSRPSSTVTPFRCTSRTSSRQEHTASPGITMNTAIPVLRCSRQPTSTLVVSRSATPRATSFSMPPGRSIPNASFVVNRWHHVCTLSPTSTDPKTQKPRRTGWPQIH